MTHFHKKHHSFSSKEVSIKILLLCFVINIVFVAIEAFWGWRSNSTALLSDAGHNLSDTLGLLLSLVAIVMEKSKNLGSKLVSRHITLINGLLLLTAVVIIVVESVKKIVSPQEIDTEVVILTSSIAIVINGLTAWLLMKNQCCNINVKVAYLHAATDMLVSVGVVVSGVVIFFTRWYIIDPILSLFVSIVVAVPSTKLIKEALMKIINS